MRFSVTIHYREPDYARSRGIANNEYSGTFEVVADTEDEAVRLATAEFGEAARRSSVGWQRDISRVTVSAHVTAR